MTAARCKHGIANPHQCCAHCRKELPPEVRNQPAEIIDIQPTPNGNRIYRPPVVADFSPRGRAYKGQNVLDPHLARSRSRWGQGLVGRRGGTLKATTQRPQQYVDDDWNADHSGFAETHDRVNEGHAKYKLAEEKEPETLQRPDEKEEGELPELKLTPIEDAAKESVTGDVYERDNDLVITVAKAWGIETDDGKSGPKKRDLMRRASKKQRKEAQDKMRALSLALDGHSWDEIAKILNWPRKTVRAWRAEMVKKCGAGILKKASVGSEDDP